MINSQSVHADSAPLETAPDAGATLFTFLNEGTGSRCTPSD